MYFNSCAVESWAGYSRSRHLFSLTTRATKTMRVTPTCHLTLSLKLDTRGRCDVDGAITSVLEPNCSHKPSLAAQRSLRRVPHECMARILYQNGDEVFLKYNSLMLKVLNKNLSRFCKISCLLTQRHIMQ